MSSLRNTYKEIFDQLDALGNCEPPCESHAELEQLAIIRNQIYDGVTWKVPVYVCAHVVIPMINLYAAEREFSKALGFYVELESHPEFNNINFPQSLLGISGRMEGLRFRLGDLSQKEKICEKLTGRVYERKYILGFLSEHLALYEPNDPIPEQLIDLCITLLSLGKTHKALIKACYECTTVGELATLINEKWYAWCMNESIRRNNISMKASSE